MEITEPRTGATPDQEPLDGIDLETEDDEIEYEEDEEDDKE